MSPRNALTWVAKFSLGLFVGLVFFSSLGGW